MGTTREITVPQAFQIASDLNPQDFDCVVTQDGLLFNRGALLGKLVTPPSFVLLHEYGPMSSPVTSLVKFQYEVADRT